MCRPPANTALINTYASLVEAEGSVSIYALRVDVPFVRAVVCATTERFAIIAVYVTVGGPVLTTIIAVAVKSVWGRHDVVTE